VIRKPVMIVKKKQVSIKGENKSVDEKKAFLKGVYLLRKPHEKKKETFTFLFT